MALTSKLHDIGDAIRAKTGKSTYMTLEQMVTEIASIQTGGGSSEAFGLRLLAQDVVVFDNFTATAATTIITLRPTFPYFDNEHASFLIGLMVRRGGFVEGQPMFSVSCVSNFINNRGGPSFAASCSYLGSDGTTNNLPNGYGVFFRVMNSDSGATVGARCNSTVPSITGTYDVYLYEIK